MEKINKILMIVPSRNRVEKVKEFIKCWEETSTEYSGLLFMIDNDDEQLEEYLKIKNYNFHVGPRKRMGPAVNLGVKIYPNYKYYGIAGDDHRFRTKNWDKMMIDRIESNGGGWGIAYGNDLYQGSSLPTAGIISANIIDIMGYMIPPKLIHLKIDRSWKILGKSIGLLFYMPEIIIEHLHPSAKKAVMDEIYEECNSKEMYEHDGLEYNRWVKEELPEIVEKIKNHD